MTFWQKSTKIWTYNDFVRFGRPPTGLKHTSRAVSTKDTKGILVAFVVNSERGHNSRASLISTEKMPLLTSDALETETKHWFYQ